MGGGKTIDAQWFTRHTKYTDMCVTSTQAILKKIEKPAANSIGLSHARAAHNKKAKSTRAESHDDDAPAPAGTRSSADDQPAACAETRRSRAYSQASDHSTGSSNKSAARLSMRSSRSNSSRRSKRSGRSKSDRHTSKKSRGKSNCQWA